MSNSPSPTENASTVVSPPYRPRNLLFVICLTVLLCVAFALGRLGLMLRNTPLLADLSATDILRCYLIGLRFDLAAAGYILLAFAPLMFFPFYSIDRCRTTRRVFYWAFLTILGACAYLVLAEYEFFREFQVRYNQVAINYLDQPQTVGGMIWKGYPVIRYTLLWVAGMVCVALLLRLLMRRLYRNSDAIGASWRYASYETVSAVAVCALLVVAVRGGLQGTPLRWGDAFKSRNDVANQMSLNGLYTLGHTVLANARASDDRPDWMAGLSLAASRAEARRLLIANSDQLLAPDVSTALRTSAEEHRTLELKDSGRKPNVVVVLMESFSGQATAAGDVKQQAAPHFNELAREGILFDRCFSIGTHTHQGIFGTLLSFPNLPGYETLMQSPLSNQSFASLPRLLQDQGYSTMFLYNGNFAWDNMRGFFKKQGIDRFIGGEDFDSKVRRDAVWGVDDLAVFQRANQEFEAANRQGPFLGVVLTLSNHAPWDLPPFPGDSTGDDGPVRGIKYADWALGQFMDEARSKSYFKDTLFVFVGDHGSRVIGKKLTAASLLTHHVPLLFYAPGLLPAGMPTDHTVSSQLNIVPTILGLLRIRSPHCSWARDLFTVEGRQESVALFKGSGGDASMAFVRDDRVFVTDEAGKAVLYHYSLSPSPFADEVADPVAARIMQDEMQALIFSAMSDLLSMRAGPIVAAPALAAHPKPHVRPGYN